LRWFCAQRLPWLALICMLCCIVFKFSVIHHELGSPHGLQVERPCCFFHHLTFTRRDLMVDRGRHRTSAHELYAADFPPCCFSWLHYTDPIVPPSK
jgi:hypothetical protein